ncbi:2-dehydro-3-deoxygalactonokinase [Pseudomonas sp. CCI3.2]|uniref:2-dehydro-3-deoxygalactonokinase n=1 Tax=unclassified Pseudomonas TaxID=196821 RepID=UPI002AC96A88|nr:MULTISPECIES: 2-dehydro-3-deoxygalactonokinase [unclassified Pseudomonas]MEB0078972.1 2-dehydro-3-deoxygalactonokinase [Pseudomonas sp. MH10out]MEB0094340.1 2-dehydro-3-deoxygalactonokinase [Pseudomonas sp. CCI4.2]MEB0101264.1 2-dehydro-3-deoxygalactonokinase [Pseudomonas sp. CCI3.2]MEB0131371.1 2-dehydro-3-deoxygalactonokinase [Pseudomonas sp. CCI2.4]MEB0159456.1 2-dehydro-3-deoxygalactonokinase [Pseudomonas sp. AH2 (2023)]
MQAHLIALDWGTTSLRAYRLGEHGQVLDQRFLSAGIMQLPTTPRLIAGVMCANGFELAFDEACGDWLDAQPGTPVIACGMVGSAQGWREAVYRETPADVAGLSAALQTVRSARGVDVHIVPGVLQRSALPNVMRGEETQVLGILASLPIQAPEQSILIGLPGSHSKWVQVADGCIVHFDTFMTGEVYAALSTHTILGRTMRISETFDGAAFDRGVEVALSDDGAAGPLSTIFSCRTLGLTGELSADAQPDYLSGLLIGHELVALAALQRRRHALDTRLPPIILIGNAQLCARYSRALAACGFAQVTLAEQATERGLWQLAVQANLLKPTFSEV